MSWHRKHYNDRAQVWHYVKSKQGGETIRQLELLHDALPCFLSQTGLAKNNQTAVQNDIRYDAKLFCSPAYSIAQGCVIDVSRGGQTRRYVAGEPFVYATHQEIGLTRETKA
ncbi:hypothetical protein [Paenibacillus sanguinis]|uniref:hypothetical protein n=1 Tax=Paenibacillus sanguinis TaxID=225906 RepID=UPI00036346A4|nr:hypothetical protein [Paenibacillus sanguinis]